MDRASCSAVTAIARAAVEVPGTCRGSGQPGQCLRLAGPGSVMDRATARLRQPRVKVSGSDDRLSQAGQCPSLLVRIGDRPAGLPGAGG